MSRSCFYFVMPLMLLMGDIHAVDNDVFNVDYVREFVEHPFVSLEMGDDLEDGICASIWVEAA